MSLQLAVGLIATFGLAASGTPSGYAIIVRAIAYLTVSGQDVALAGERILAGLYESLVLLAVPVFIVAMMTGGGRHPRGYAAAITAASPRKRRCRCGACEGARCRPCRALLLPAILLYGIYGGVTTPTEAAPVGVVIGGALILNDIVASENIPATVARALVGLEVPALLLLLGVNLLLLVLGCVLDATTIILVILRLLLPARRELGIDLVQFGVVAVGNCMTGPITPPDGILLFVVNAVTRVPLAEIIGEIWGFIVASLTALLILVLFPDGSLFRPRAFGHAGT